MGPVVLVVVVVAKPRRIPWKYSPWSATVDNLVHVQVQSFLCLVPFACVHSVVVSNDPSLEPNRWCFVSLIVDMTVRLLGISLVPNAIKGLVASAS